MVKGFVFNSSISIWDIHENERVKIGVKMCRNPSILRIYGTCGVANCILVLIETVHEDCEQRKLLS
jgi:hypothetical protein